MADAAPEHQAEADAQAVATAATVPDDVASTTTSTSIVSDATGTAADSDAGPTGEAFTPAAGAPTVAPTMGAPTVAPVAGGDAGPAGAATTVPYGVGDGGTAYDPASVRSVLLFSPDGITWSADRLSLPDPTVGGYAGDVVTADHVVVSTPATAELGSEGQPLLGRRAFIGTLAG